MVAGKNICIGVARHSEVPTVPVRDVPHAGHEASVIADAGKEKAQVGEDVVQQGRDRELMIAAVDAEVGHSAPKPSVEAT